MSRAAPPARRTARLGPTLISVLAFVGCVLLLSQLSLETLLAPPSPPVSRSVPEASSPFLADGALLLRGHVVATGPAGLAVLRKEDLGTVGVLPEVRGHSLAALGTGRVLVASRHALFLVDLRRPASPTVEARSSAAPPGGFGGVAAADQDLFAAAGPAGVYRLVPEGRTLRVAQVLEGPRNAQAVAVTGEDLAIADGEGGLLIRTPDGGLGRLRLPGFARDVATAGNYCAVALGEGGLAVADLTVRAEPKLIFVHDLARPLHVRFQEPRLAVTTRTGVGLLDFTIPAEPRPVEWWRLREPPSSLALAGEHVVTATPEGLFRFRAGALGP